LHKDLLTINDLTTKEIREILDLAKKLKSELKKNKNKPYLDGKTLAMVFEKPSTRTRVSFEVGMWQLGGHTINLHPGDIQLGKRESISDFARTLSRYVDGIMLRVFEHEKVTEMAKWASVPVINGLSDNDHPCQALADVLTIEESGKKLKGLKLVYLGDGNNVARSLADISEKMGINFVMASPDGFHLSKTAFPIHNDPFIAAKDADVIYTDVWASMGQESEMKERLKHFKPFQANSRVMAVAKKDAIFLHCLPAHRGEEVSETVIESAQSRVFDQAENRLHVQKAVLLKFLGKK